ncbi:MAG TPA: hypothetical protein VE861_06660, partial [Gemmatimonadaceae bacterium]|nr:hypothetical protein [Gemmatimonadaceae bacterium]
MRLPDELRDPDRRRPPVPPDPVPSDPVPEPIAYGPGAQTTESAMAVPTWRQLFRLIGRALRLRCPNCGVGAVLRPYATVNDHCTHCGFRFTRSTDSYYSGAMLTNLAVAELLFALVFVGVLLGTWPD